MISLKKLTKKLKNRTPVYLELVIGRFNDGVITALVPRAEAIRKMRMRSKVVCLGIILPPSKLPKYAEQTSFSNRKE